MNDQLQDMTIIVYMLVQVVQNAKEADFRKPKRGC